MGSGTTEMIMYKEEKEIDIEELNLDQSNYWKNQRYLEVFEKDLRSRGIGERTIRKHMANVDCYINGYLMEYVDKEMEDGCREFAHYISMFYILKDMNACAYNLRCICASVKKFYRCMMGNGFIGREQYEMLKNTIKDELEVWIDELTEYNQTTQKKINKV